HAGVRPTMHGPGRYPGTVRGIMIVGPGIAQIQGSGAERLLHGTPLLDGRTRNGNGATAPMIRGLAEVALIFQADKRGQHLGTGPAGAAQGRPAIKVLGETAHGNLGVDGGAPPHATASEVQSRRLYGRAAGEQSRPMIPFVRKQRKMIRTLDLWWCVGSTIIRAGFHQEDRHSRILRQARGERWPGRTCTNNDVLVWHKWSQPRQHKDITKLYSRVSTRMQGAVCVSRLPYCFGLQGSCAETSAGRTADCGRTAVQGIAADNRRAHVGVS